MLHKLAHLSPLTDITVHCELTLHLNTGAATAEGDLSTSVAPLSPTVLPSERKNTLWKLEDLYLVCL